MNDMQVHLRKIRSDAAECQMLSNLATEGKRELFARIAEHLNALASEVEQTMAVSGTVNGVDAPSAANRQQAVAADREAAAVDLKQAVAADHLPARPWWVRPTLLAVVLVTVAGGVALAIHHAKRDSHPASSLQSNAEPSRAPQDDMKQAIEALLSSSEGERKIVRDEMGALTARLASLERTLNNIERSRAEIKAPQNRQAVGGEEKAAPAESKSPAPEEKPARIEEGGDSGPAKPTPAEADSDPIPSHGAASAGGTSIVEPVDRVGAISETRRAEADSPKAVVGPPGCTRFRSFDPVSGTYLTFEGRRRQCR
jgi:hypothetical protein